MITLSSAALWQMTMRLTNDGADHCISSVALTRRSWGQRRSSRPSTAEESPRTSGPAAPAAAEGHSTAASPAGQAPSLLKLAKAMKPSAGRSTSFPATAAVSQRRLVGKLSSFPPPSLAASWNSRSVQPSVPLRTWRPMPGTGVPSPLAASRSGPRSASGPTSRARKPGVRPTAAPKIMAARMGLQDAAARPSPESRPWRSAPLGAGLLSAAAFGATFPLAEAPAASPSSALPLSPAPSSWQAFERVRLAAMSREYPQVQSSTSQGIL
mmetsp:Transcript_59373/g.184299  ORF Transcript_59373/g.184299 Transcript_59373/m.184299 type:complete len:268 (+) Transcript_59373:174-977(+)